MEVKVKIRTITILDDSSGEKYSVKTVRTAKEIAEELEESEKEIISDKVSQAVGEALNS